MADSVKGQTAHRDGDHGIEHVYGLAEGADKAAAGHPAESAL